MKHAAVGIQALPHKFPFVMLDRVLEVEPGRRAQAEKLITRGSHFETGGGVYYPEMFLLEAMAQLGAVAAAAQGGAAADGEARTGYLAAISDARFYRRPRVGDRVVFAVEYEAGMGGLVRFSGSATIDGERAAEVKLTFTVPGA